MSKTIAQKLICLLQISALSLTTSALPLLSVVEPAQAQAVPSCMNTVTWTSGLRRYVRVRNNCSTTQRVRIIWAFATDGACITYLRGRQVTAYRLRPAVFAGLRRC